MLFIVEPVVVRVICRCGMPINEDNCDPNAEPDEEHIETATEGDEGLGVLVGVANGLILLAIGASSIGAVGMLVWWIVRHGR